MLCVECATPVKCLYVYYSPDNIHTVKCGACGKFADKYIECDMMLIFIDLLLLRAPAIRHVVFNSMAEKQGSPPPNTRASPSAESAARLSSPMPPAVQQRHVFGVPSIVLRLLIFVSLLDVFIQWAMSEKSTEPAVVQFLIFTSPVIQYLVFMTLSFCDTVLQHVLIRTLARYLLGWKDGSAISTSLLIGSFFTLLPILTFIWHYDIPFLEQVVRYVSPFCLTEILAVTLNSGYLAAGFLTLAGRITSLLLRKLFWTLVPRI